MRRLLQLLSLSLALSLTLGQHVANNGVQGFTRPDLPGFLKGDYCSKPGVGQTQQCCDSRDDDCSRPIYGTLCYCDRFCDSHGMDCCPDYFDVCRLKEAEPLKRCPRMDYNTQQLAPGQSAMDNCNLCSCQTAANKETYLQCEKNACLVRPPFINQHNRNSGYHWTASDYKNTGGVDFFGKTLDWGLQSKLGVLGPELKQLRTRNLGTLNRNIPRGYDLRDHTVGVSPIRNQGSCGASWAYAVAGLLTDKMIADSAGQVNKQVSAQQLIDCNRKDQRGCQGGHVDRALMFLNLKGGVSDSCYPEKFRQEPYCPDNLKDVLGMKADSKDIRCDNGYTAKAISSSSSYRVAEGRRIDSANMQVEIMERGAVLALFRVESDFYMYRSGVYRHDPYKQITNQDHPTAYHAVRIIGWGHDRAAGKYWICANSWGTSWGEDGYFRIVRGENHCDIEKYVIAIGNINYDNTLLSRKYLALHRSKKLRKHRRRVRSVVDLLERDQQLEMGDKNEVKIEPEFQVLKKHHGGGKKHQGRKNHHGGKHHKNRRHNRM